MNSANQQKLGFLLISGSLSYVSGSKLRAYKRSWEIPRVTRLANVKWSWRPIWEGSLLGYNPGNTFARNQMGEYDEWEFVAKVWGQDSSIFVFPGCPVQ